MTYNFRDLGLACSGSLHCEHPCDSEFVRSAKSPAPLNKNFHSLQAPEDVCYLAAVFSGADRSSLERPRKY